MKGWKQFWDIDKKQYYWSKQNDERKNRIMKQWRLQMENEHVVKLQSRYRMKKAEKNHTRKKLEYKSATTIQLQWKYRYEYQVYTYAI